MSGMDRLTDEQWAVQYLEDDAEACSAVNGSHDQTTKDARRLEVLVKRLIRERDEARRASQAAPAPVAYRVRFAGEGAGDWAMASQESAVHYIGRDGYECQPLYAAPAPSDGLREAAPKAMRMPKLHPRKEYRLVCQTNGVDGYREGWNDAVRAMRRAALTPAPAQEGDRRHD